MVLTISDLTPVPLKGFQGFIGTDKIVYRRGDSQVRPLLFQPSEEGIPDLFALLRQEWRIMDYNMDSRNEGVIESPNAVASQE